MKSNIYGYICDICVLCQCTFMYMFVYICIFVCVLPIEHLSNCTLDSVLLYIYIVGPFPSLPYISNAIQWVNTSKFLIDADVRHQCFWHHLCKLHENTYFVNLWSFIQARQFKLKPILTGVHISSFISFIWYGKCHIRMFLFGTSLVDLETFLNIAFQIWSYRLIGTSIHPSDKCQDACVSSEGTLTSFGTWGDHWF